MIDFQLNIGDVATHVGPASYTCFGLGSCIGLFLQDRLTGHSGGAHIFLPVDGNTKFEYGKYYSVKAALDELLRQLLAKGNCLVSLRAKIVGGANVLNSTVNTGGRNLELLKQELINRKIYLAAEEVGGTHSRTAIFNANSGELSVRILQINQTKVL